MSSRPSANTCGTEQKRTAALPTPEFDVPGLTQLSHLREGDQIELDSHTNPLTVTFVGVRDISLPNGDTARQYAIEAEHDRADARTHEIYESINLADGSVIELVDGRGVPVRVFEVAQ